jgi:xanthine dehydrogenase YagS FAD-binding subunit
MKDFGYTRADSPASAVAAVADRDVSLLAGGTELLNWFRLGISAPDGVVDIGALDELRGIEQRRSEQGASELRIGALATLNEVGEHPLVAAGAGALASACLQAASAQVRNRATLGGNVLQRTRCAYFRAEEPVPWPCNKRTPGSGCAAYDGRHGRHAIFGWTEECVAVQPSDPAVALSALDAQIDVIGPGGARTIPMSGFHLTPREAGDPMTETRLGADELILGYRIPTAAPGGQAYVKVRERASYEYAIVSAAATVVRSGERIRSARVALGSVAQRPWRLPAAEAELVGAPLTRDALLPIIERAMSDAVPLPHNGFKVGMARNAAVRALLAAGGAR